VIEKRLFHHPGSIRFIELRPLALSDFHRRPVLGVYCSRYHQLVKLEKRLRQNGIDVYEADVRPPEC
jgi:DNA polymerase-2